MSYNKLSGSIPFQICNLSWLATLDLSHNFISGEIPFYFGELTNLLNLDLSHNNLTGTIPFSLFYKTSKTDINLSYNSLNGTISVVLVKALPLDSLMGNKELHIALFAFHPTHEQWKKQESHHATPKTIPFLILNFLVFFLVGNLLFSWCKFEK